MGVLSPEGSLESFEPATAVLTVSAPEALVQGALADMRIAQGGVHHAWEHLRSGALKVVLYDIHHPGRYEMLLQYPHRTLMAPRVRVTADYLLEVFEHDSSLHVPLAGLRTFAT
ncbi:type 2 periplasmic-binding domain-containing protein [Paraburkholderia nodosa]|uniref:hypothetical protein n=1 Tax=Paraburkholderia nodosa TaxID=392320 RepID=UPI00048663F1|nr:hypothetical protein [Paraburkholderia nodosa]